MYTPNTVFRSDKKYFAKSDLDKFVKRIICMYSKNTIFLSFTNEADSTKK